jgi:hypothetical protein
MIITALRIQHLAAVERLIGLCWPCLLPRTSSDYWLYAELSCGIRAATPVPRSPSGHTAASPVDEGPPTHRMRRASQAAYPSPAPMLPGREPW